MTKKVTLNLTDRQHLVLSSLIVYCIEELNEYSDTKEAIAELKVIKKQVDAKPKPPKKKAKKG